MDSGELDEVMGMTWVKYVHILVIIIIIIIIISQIY